MRVRFRISFGVRVREGQGLRLVLGWVRVREG